MSNASEMHERSKLGEIRQRLVYHRLGSDNVSREYCIDVEWLLAERDALHNDLGIESIRCERAEAERDALREALEQVAAAFSEDDKAEALERIRLIVTAPGLTPPFAKSKAAAEGNDAETGAVSETLGRPE